MEDLAARRVERKVCLLNKYGLHIRPASLFTKVASRYNADIYVEKEGTVVSGKSILALMTLGAACGTELLLTAIGEQSAEAIKELAGLVSRKFDIPEEQE